MPILKTIRTSSLERRTKRVRAKIASSDRPRLTVSRSNRFISAQLVREGKTLASSTSRGMGLTGKTAAEAVGKDIAQKISSLNIKDIVFDRGRFSYEGNIKVLADAAREAGLNF